jgi:hypothetical protein
VTLGNAMFIGFVLSLVLDNTVKGKSHDIHHDEQRFAKKNSEPSCRKTLFIDTQCHVTYPLLFIDTQCHVTYPSVIYTDCTGSCKSNYHTIMTILSIHYCFVYFCLFIVFLHI